MAERISLLREIIADCKKAESDEIAMKQRAISKEKQKEDIKAFIKKENMKRIT